jgi:hypothetical protein
MRRIMVVCAAAAMLAALSGSDVAIARGQHRFFRNRFAFIGVGGGGWGYSGCYTRVWTYYGWVWRNVCY